MKEFDHVCGILDELDECTKDLRKELERLEVEMDDEVTRLKEEIKFYEDKEE